MFADAISSTIATTIVIAAARRIGTTLASGQNGMRTSFAANSTSGKPPTPRAGGASQVRLMSPII